MSYVTRPKLPWIEATAFLFFTGLIVLQLFIPPVLGLANSGDFSKVIGRFDLWSPEKYENKFAVGQYAIDPKHQWDSCILSSEVLLTAAAVKANALFGRTGVFDLRWMGAVHGAIYLAALGLLLPVVGRLPAGRRAAFLVAVLLIFGDVLYVSALNSFYMDTAAFVFVCLSAVLYVRACLWNRWTDRVGLVAALALLCTAKTQHALTALIAFAATAWVWYRGRSKIGVAVVAVVGLGSLGLVLWGTPREYGETPSFNVIFYRLLPLSPNVSVDLARLGLDESYRKYIGTHAYGPESPIGDWEFVRRFGERTGHARIGLYYLSHPGVALRLMAEAADETSRQRPVLGNYDPRDGAAFQENNTIAFWSSAKRCLFWPRGMVYLAFVGGLLALFAWLLWRDRRALGECLVCGAYALLLMTLAELMVASLGDVLDSIRHHFVFTGLTDMVIVCVVGILVRERRAA